MEFGAFDEAETPVAAALTDDFLAATMDKWRDEMGVAEEGRPAPVDLGHPVCAQEVDYAA